MDKIKFSDNISIPSFFLSVYPKHKNVRITNNNFSIKGNNKILNLKYSGVFPTPKVCETDNFFTVILGSPVLNDTINYGDICTVFNQKDNVNSKFFSSIDAEFLIISFDKKTDKLIVVNDRYTSVPFYYILKEDVFYGSPYFTDMWKMFKNHLKYNMDGILEFIYFQRLLGEKTYLQDVFFMADASFIILNENKLTIDKYWIRDYTKTNLSLKDNAELMAGLIKESIERKTSDNKRYGLFLSGGMDSRTILGAFDSNLPTCFTATLFKNREFVKAHEIAVAKGAEHIYLQLDPEHYSKIFKSSVEIIGGMYNYDHGLFLGYSDAVTSKTDVCFHGHGLDYMFQGMYIPSKRIKLFGRSLYLTKMRKIPEDVSKFFIENVSYRIKNASIVDFIRSEKRSEIEARLYKSVDTIYKRAKKLTSNKFDQFEYLTFHNISRHYSFPNHASIASYVEQRTITFDNKLFDFYLSLPVEQRFTGKIEKECLKILSPQLARIWNANTNLPVTAYPLRQTSYQLMTYPKKLINVYKKGNKYREERTWPSREYVLRNQSVLKKEVINICKSGILDEVTFLDTGKIKTLFPRWLEGDNIKSISAELVQTILTLGTFLKIK